MDYCFDTSAINRLHDDPDQRAIVVGLLTANRVLITAINVMEAVVTEDPARRISLLLLQKQLATEIWTAYRHLVRKYHPGRSRYSKTANAEMFRQVQEAYAELRSKRGSWVN
jgi:hypothetical protein